MGYSLGVHVADGPNQLREVEVRHVLADALVRLDLVEQVAALGQLHGDPRPHGVFARADAVDYVLVLSEISVEGDFHGQLLGREPALLEGMLFANKLNGDDGFWGVGRTCFSYSTKASISIGRAVMLVPDILTRRMLLGLLFLI